MKTDTKSLNLTIIFNLIYTVRFWIMKNNDYLSEQLTSGCTNKLIIYIHIHWLTIITWHSIEFFLVYLGRRQDLKNKCYNII